jgi:hypothetical protein
MFFARFQLTVATLALITAGVSADAQDGWLVRAKPPIVVSYASDEYLHFTNTSDKNIHGIKLHWTEDGNDRSLLIIDTIHPHKTVFRERKELEECCALEKHYTEATLTCDGYSSPIKIAQ